MPHDEKLAERVRKALVGTPGTVEKKMFGGVAFMVNGAMCVGVDRTDLIIRCEKDETDELLKRKGVREFDLSGGRPMKGWLLVGTEATRTTSGFQGWIDFALNQTHRAGSSKSVAKAATKKKARRAAGYDERLADRVRELLSQRGDVIEKRMFGGLCFMVRGHMCCGLTKTDFMVRVGPDQFDKALREPHARPMDFTGRPSKGMVYVDSAGLVTKPGLRKWVERGIAYVDSLPKKAVKG